MAISFSVKPYLTGNGIASSQPEQEQTQRMERAQGIERALEIIRPVELAKRLGVRRQNVHAWKKAGRVPLDHVIEVSRLTGVPYWELLALPEPSLKLQETERVLTIMYWHIAEDAARRIVELGLGKKDDFVGLRMLANGVIQTMRQFYTVNKDIYRRAGVTKEQGSKHARTMRARGYLKFDEDTELTEPTEKGLEMFSEFGELMRYFVGEIDEPTLEHLKPPKPRDE